MALDETIGAQIEASGWRTGSVVSIDSQDTLRNLIKKSGRPGLSGLVNGRKPVIVSQWCDLVHPSLEAEPNFEVILARESESYDPNKGPGRSSRCLHLETFSLGTLEFSAHDITPLPRESLLSLDRDASKELSFAEAMGVMSWIGKRYFRVPIPTALTKRMPFGKDPVRAKFKRLTKYIHEVRASIAPADVELDEHTEYLVQLYLIFKSQANVPEIAKDLDWLKAWAQSLKGVKLQINARAADSFSYAEALATSHLDLDSLTYGPNGSPSAGLAPLLG